MWELDCEESWAPKNWCFWTVVLEKTLESPLDCKQIQPIHSERDQPWDFFGRNDAKAETPVLGPPHAKSWLIGKDSDAGRDLGQEEKRTIEDEMAGWHHRLNGPESEWTPGVGDGQGGLACWDSWGLKESVTTEQLNWTERQYFILLSQDRSIGFDNVLDWGEESEFSVKLKKPIRAVVWRDGSSISAQGWQRMFPQKIILEQCEIWKRGHWNPFIHQKSWPGYATMQKWQSM